MALSDITIPLTAKRGGALYTSGSRPKVFYLKLSDLDHENYSSVRGNTIIKVKYRNEKIEIFESPDEFGAVQSLAQGATANAYVTKAYQALAPTSSATFADFTVASRYMNEVSTINGGTVKLPDPFVKRLVIINNLTTGVINVRGSSAGNGGTGASAGSLINGGTGAYVIPALKRVHFLAPTAGTAGTTASWVTAIDA